MDMKRLAELLQATLEPKGKNAAEEQLKRLEKLNGFAPTLLQTIMNPTIVIPVRLAGSLFLKNLVISSWLQPTTDEPARFQIQEPDRVYIRDCLIDAIVHGPPLIRAQLLVCVQFIMKHDFPEGWPTLVNKLMVHLQSPDSQVWPGALSALLELGKRFNTRKKESDHDRAVADDAMNLLLPFVQQIMERLLQPDPPQDGLMMQHLILKLLCTLSESHLLSFLLSKTNGQWDKFQGWMQLLGLILTRQNPNMEQKPSDENSRSELEKSEWWKTKKWTIRILSSLLKKKDTIKDYKEFLEHYVSTYSKAVIEEMFKILKSFRFGHFVAGEVMRYLDYASRFAHSWEFIKPNANHLLTDVIIPLMCQCHSEEAEQLWKEDPIEYNRAKYGKGITSSTVSCGEELLKTLCKKKKVSLVYIPIIIKLLNDPDTVASPQRMDGALHIVGAIAEADVLLKKNPLKKQIKDVLMRHVFMCMEGPHPFLRARAAWLASRLSLLSFRDEALSKVVTGLVTAVLKKEEQLPVRIQSALAIEDLVIDQHRSHQYFQPHIGPLCLELLEMLRNTEDDDLSSTLRKIFKTFPAEVAPLAHEICVHIVHTFNLIMEGAGGTGGEKSDMIKGLVQAMERILEVMQDQPDLSLHYEPILQLTSTIFDKAMVSYYKTGFSLIESITSKTEHITPAMWKLFECLYRVVERDGSEHFLEMMTAFHNYITVDTTGFLGDPKRVLVICIAIKKVMVDDSAKVGEVAECHAAKLIEVLILQCGQQIQKVMPGLLQLVLERLTRRIETCELRTMCLQVIMASLYNDVNQTLSVISIAQLEAFIRQWISEVKEFSGVHDRKFFVLGVCALLQSQNGWTPLLQQLSNEILPTLISLLKGLKLAYSASENASLDSGSYSSSVTEVHSGSSSEEDADESSENEDDEVMNGVDANDNDKENCGHISILMDYKAYLDRYWYTTWDSKECSDDEFVAFKEVLLHLERFYPTWYSGLTSTLSAKQRKSMQEIFNEADKRQLS